MAVTRTTLAAAITSAHDLAFTLTSNAGASVGGFIRINGEYATVVETGSGGLVKVRHRGANGSRAVTHPALATVTVGLWSDLPDKTLPNIGQDEFEEVGIGASGAFTSSGRNQRVNLSGSGAIALTLANPAANIPDGVEVEFIGVSAHAHTITYTPGFQQNTVSADVATFEAGGGGVCKIRTQGGKWTMAYAIGVTVA